MKKTIRSVRRADAYASAIAFDTALVELYQKKSMPLSALKEAYAKKYKEELKYGLEYF